MRYLIEGEIDSDMNNLFHVMEQDTDKVIFLDINSQGGSCAVGLLALGVLQRARRKGQKIITRNRGIAFSEAARLLSQGCPIYLTDVAVTMFHPAYTVGGWPTSLEDIVDIIKDKWNNWGKRDFLSIINNELARYEPIDLVVEHFKDSKFQGDYYLLPRDLQKVLGRQVRVKDIPQKYLDMRTVKIDHRENGEAVAVILTNEDEEADFDLADQLDSLEESEFLDLYTATIAEMQKRQAEIAENIQKFDEEVATTP